MIGIRNVNGAPDAFTLQVRFGGSLIREVPQIHLAPGQTWQTLVDLPAPPSDLVQVDAALFLPDQGTVAYRQVSLR